MSEQKRVTLTTISSTVSSSTALFLGDSTAAATLRFGNDFRRGTDKAGGSSNAADNNTVERKGVDNTVRLKLELFQTDSSSYPEFNYSKLEKKKLKKMKEKINGWTDPFDTNDDDVVRIAKELEQKYGTTYEGGGRGRSKKDDHCDIGLGYDETDSFIDNTEAYDEIVPEEVETMEGGFYINCGALQFKKLYIEPIKTKTDEIIKMPNRPRKRVLSSSSSDDSSSTDDADEVNNDKEGNDEGSGSAKADGLKKVKDPGPAEKRHKTNSGSSNKCKSAQQNGSGKRKDKPNAFSGSSSNSPKPAVEEMGSDSDRERARQQKNIKTTTVKDMLKAKRDNFFKMQVGGESKNLNGELKGAVSKSSEDEDSSSEESDGSSGHSGSDRSAPYSKQPKKSASNVAVNEENLEKLRTVDTKLPELDADVIMSILDFRELIKTKGILGKRFQFDDKLTETFLKIDESLLCVDKAQRNMVFAHLEYHLLLPKYYFLRKAKQLRIKEEKLNSKRALTNLRKAVIEAMPGAIANYEVELRKAADSQSGNLNLEHPPKMPKKKFTWTSNLRKLLYEVYHVRWTSYPVLGTRKETLEEFINGYLRDKVVEVWPSGWIRYEELQKEIERRKAVMKKVSKSKKKSLPIATVASGSTDTTAGTSQVTNLAGISAGTVSAVNLYMKQFEEFASSSRSCANSDTDSAASSSGTSGGVKRRNVDVVSAAASGKPSRGKMQKTNSEQNQQQATISHSENNRKMHQFASTKIALPQELIPPSRKTDHSIHSIISAAATATVTTATMNTCAAMPTTSFSQAQSQKKHSVTKSLPPQTGAPAAHIIDLDNYTSTRDILQTSKELMFAESVNSAVAMVKKRCSSSESDSVEIVGVFQANPVPPVISVGVDVSSCGTTTITAVPATGKTTKSGKRNAVNSQTGRNAAHKAVTSTSELSIEPIASVYKSIAGLSKMHTNISNTGSTSTSTSNNNNTQNNHNNKKNTGIGVTAGMLPEIDVSQVVDVLKRFENASKHNAMLTIRNSTGKDNQQQ